MYMFRISIALLLQFSDMNFVFDFSENEPQVNRRIEKNALFNGKLFSNITMEKNGKNFKARCILCSPQNVYIKGSVTTNANFFKHLKSKHGNGMAIYHSLKNESQKRKLNNSGSQKDPPQKLTKQTYIDTFNTQRPTMDQKIFDKRIVKFIVDTMSPTSIVDHPSFKSLFSWTNLSVMSRRSLVREMDEVYNKMISNIKHELSKVNYVCSTADVWSSKKRSFFGVTIHWIDDELNRHSRAIACRRFKGQHTFNKIAEVLEHVHLCFDLDPYKVVSTVTDNGSNFVKAFKEYGVKFEDADEDSDSGDEDSLQIENIDNDEATEPVLPRHYRCASHTLNLIATTDINNAINKNVNLRSKHEKVIKKCSLLWNKANRPKSAEIIQNVLGHTLSNPTVTRWNSFFNSINQILKAKSKLKLLFEKLEIKEHTITDSEIQYLENYTKVLEPIAATLNYLQGQNNTFFGLLLPSICSLKVKLERMRDNIDLGHSKIILEAAIGGLKRFDYLFDMNNEIAKQSIVAAVTHPKIKMKWINIFKEKNPIADASIIQKIVIDASRTLRASLRKEESDSSDPDKLMEEDDFFDFNDIQNSSTTSVGSIGGNTAESSTSTNKIELEILKYLEDRSTPSSINNTLTKYKMIRQLFQLYNTSLPSSAPVERLFSFATATDSPRRNRLSDNLFEKLILLKANNTYQ